MNSKTIFHIKNLLNDCELINSCQAKFIPKSIDTGWRDIFVLDNINNTNLRFGIRLGSQANYSQSFEEDVTGEKVETLQFLFELNLKLKDFKKIDEALFVISLLNIDGIDFTYVRDNL